MKTKQIDQLKRARTGLRGWMTRDFDAVLDMMESDSPEVSRVEEKLDSNSNCCPTAKSRGFANGD